MKNNNPFTGFCIGILLVDYDMQLFCGNVANARTFDYPVLYEVVKGITVEQIMSGEQGVSAAIIEAGQRLVDSGVKIVVGACGSFANYQKEVSANLSVPVFMSVMMQIPLVLLALPRDNKIGIIAASETTITPRICEQCNIAEPQRLIVRNVEGLASFKKMETSADDFDMDELNHDISTICSETLSQHAEIAAWLIQCSDLPPVAAAVQVAVAQPVFDMTSLIDWAAAAAMRKSFV